MEKDYQKILCPIDFSDNSTMALKRAAIIAKASHGTLTVAHIVNNPLSELYSKKIMEAWGSENDIEKMCSKKPINGFSKIIFDVVKVMVKDFSHEILKRTSYEIYVAIADHTHSTINWYAEKNGIDLIVMATHGRTGPKRIYFGSVAESIVRRAPCSVLIVRN